MGEEDSLTWDQSIADIAPLDPDDDEVPKGSRSNLLTFHAVAHGRSVLGTLPSVPQDDNSVITWQTKFDHEVVSLTSNNNGHVIASATKSHVSLIKASDGTILATRQIPPDKLRASSPNPSVVFVSRLKQLDVNDALVVFRPAENDARACIFLISNIDGPGLNSPHLNRVQDACKEMCIDAVTFPLAYVSSITGVYVNQETIRFFLAIGGSKVGVYDYNVTNRTSEVVIEDVFELVPGGWVYNDAVEMDIDDKSDARVYLTVVAHNKTGQDSICWFNVLDLSLSVQHACQFKLSSLKTVLSCNPEKCVAAVYAAKDKATKIHIVQSLVRDVAAAPKDSDSMVLFTIDADSRAQSILLASPSANETKGPYAFRFLNKFNESDATTSCVEFVSGDQERAGMVHYLLANNSFDEAYTSINEMDEHSNNILVDSSIHKSLVGLWQFRHILSKGHISSKENIIEAKECLRRLASSAISGGDKGIQGLVDAAKFLMSWPKNQTINGRSSQFATISIQEVCMALSAMSTTITSVIENVNASKAAELKEIKQKFDDRQAALRGLRSVAEVDGLKLNPDDPYLAIGSMTDLMKCLVSQGAFKSVERLMKSQWSKQLSSDAMASSVRHIPIGVDPRCFLPWLCDRIIPTLSIGDPMLESIRAWSCAAADKYDDENVLSGLDNAIMLLQV
jgi:hypothetical protein